MHGGGGSSSDFRERSMEDLLRGSGHPAKHEVINRASGTDSVRETPRNKSRYTVKGREARRARGTRREGRLIALTLRRLGFPFLFFLVQTSRPSFNAPSSRWRLLDSLRIPLKASRHAWKH